MSMDANEVNFFLENLQGVFDRYDLIDSMPDNITPVLYPRTSGYRPTTEENPHNAWYWKSEIIGASEGKLSNKTIVIKDNVMEFWTELNELTGEEPPTASK